MNLTSRTIFIISGDFILAQRCFEELSSFGGHYRTLVVGTVELARKRIGRCAPAGGFLGESAIYIAHGGGAGLAGAAPPPPRPCFWTNPQLTSLTGTSPWNPRLPCLRKPRRWS